MCHVMNEKYDPAEIDLKEIDYVWMYDVYYSKLCCIAEKTVKQKENAEDIVSEFFLKLLENAEKIHIEGYLKAYLYQGVQNNCIKHLEHIEVKRKYDEYIQKNTNVSIDILNPLDKLIAQEEANKIKKAIDILPRKCKEIFLLWEEGSSYREISQKLSISEGSVCKQISRALGKMRNHLKIRNKRK